MISTDHSSTAHRTIIMTNVSIIGIAKPTCAEHWDTSIRHLAWYRHRGAAKRTRPP